jgi:hypothetical protein
MCGKQIIGISYKILGYSMTTWSGLFLAFLRIICRTCTFLSIYAFVSLEVLGGSFIGRNIILCTGIICQG